MAGTSIMTGICTSSYPFLIPNRKSRRFLIPISIFSQCRDFSSKLGRTRTIPTWTSLFVISNIECNINLGIFNIKFMFKNEKKNENRYLVIKHIKTNINCTL